MLKNIFWVNLNVVSSYNGMYPSGELLRDASVAGMVREEET